MRAVNLPIPGVFGNRKALTAVVGVAVSCLGLVIRVLAGPGTTIGLGRFRDREWLFALMDFFPVRLSGTDRGERKGESGRVRNSESVGEM